MDAPRAITLRAMRRLALSLTALAIFVPTVHAAPFEVLVKDNYFKPKLAEIKKGRTVTWRWRGSNPHDVVVKRPDGSRAAKSVIKTSGSFSYTFRSTGTWRAICRIHENMTMKVVVRRS